MVEISDVTEYYKAKRLARQRRSFNYDDEDDVSPSKKKKNKQYIRRLRKAMAINRRKLRNNLLHIYEDIDTCDCAHDLHAMRSMRKIRNIKRLFLIGKIILGFALIGLLLCIGLAIWHTLEIDGPLRMPH